MESNERLGERLACNFAELIGQRARVLQDLWAQEVEQRIERVQYWKSREISAHWRAAVGQPVGRRQVWTWISRHGTRLLHRSGRDSSASRGNDLH
jgi:transposase